MIDIYLLEQLVAVRKNGTLIAASESLHISQPALSKSMKKLEDIMEMPLFVRSNRKIELNQTGIFFADRAAEFLSQGEAMLEQVYSYDRNLNNISVGSCAPIPFWELTPVIASLFPKMSVTTQLDTNERLIKGLAQNHYQIIVTSEIPDNGSFYTSPLCSETMSLSVPKSHPFYDRESLKPKELDGQFMIVFNDIGIWDSWIKDNFPGIHLLTVSDPNALQSAIGLGTALSFVSDYVYNMGRHDKEQKIVPLDMENKSISYYISCKKQDHSKYRKVFQRLEKTGN